MSEPTEPVLLTLEETVWEERLTALLLERAPEPTTMTMLAPITSRAQLVGLLTGGALLIGLGALAMAMLIA